MPRINLGPVSLDAVEPQEILDRIKEFIKTRTPSHVVTLNALMFNIALKNRELSETISRAALITPDSSGIIWAADQLTKTKLKRFTGIDLLNHLCAYASGSGHSVFFLGGKPGIPELAADNMVKTYPSLRVAGSHDGYFSRDDEDNLFALIASKSPDIVFVGLDMPRQELWISKNLSRFNASVIMGVGGSFDVISGNLKRAPGFMRVMHLEWFFRLCQQPWRITRMIDLPFFVLNIIRLKYT
jgi:N-acetylglucosaminyldiphosphoundecaprenol N-acetyl-beta-D-mannosaminyltransferase